MTLLKTLLKLYFLINTTTLVFTWGVYTTPGTTHSTFSGQYGGGGYTHSPHSTSSTKFRNYLMKCYDSDRLPSLTKTKPGYDNPFPLSSFLKQLNIGIDIGWYGYQCRIWTRPGECSCGESCISKGDCCIDFLWYKYHQFQSSAKHYIESVKSLTKGQSCLPMFRYVPDMSLWSGNHYIMVDSCLPGANQTYVDGCEKATVVGENNKPVYGNDRYLYKNSYCARCNNVFLYRYDFMKLSCKVSVSRNKYPDQYLLADTPFYQVLQKYPWCGLVPQYEDTILKCEPNKCSTTDAIFCQIFLGYFFNGKYTTKSTKNVFCEKCRSQNLLDGTVRKPCKSMPDGWSLVINLNSGISDNKCGLNEIKMAGGLCRAIQCGQGQRLVQGQCQQICQIGYTFSTTENKCKPLPCRMGFDRQSNGKCECLTPKFIDSTGYCRSCNGGFSHSSKTHKCQSFRNTTTEPIKSNQTNTRRPMVDGERQNNQQSFRCLDQIHQAISLFIFFQINTNNNVTNETNYSTLFNFLRRSNWRVLYENQTVFVLESTDFESDLKWKENLLNETRYNKHIDKAVLTTTIKFHDQIIPNQYGFDLTRSFSNYRLCGRFTDEVIHNANRTCNMTKTVDYNLDSKLIFTIQDGIVFEEKIYCEAFHLHSTCSRQTIYPSIYQISPNGSLLIEGESPKSAKQKVYPIDEYFPLAEGFQICIEAIRSGMTQQEFDWSKTVKNAKYHVSVIGTCFSLFSYLMFLVTLAAIKSLRNTGGLYITVLVAFLLFSDSMFLANFHLRKGSLSCTGIFVVLYWSLVNVLIWSGMVAIDMMLQFTKRSLSRSDRKESVKMLQKRLLATIAISTIICGTLLILKESDSIVFELDSKYCWFGNWYWSLAFYFIPASIEYFTCLLCLCLLLISIRKKSKESQKTLGKGQHKDVGLLKVGIKLMLILGITELLGLVQIKRTNLTENESILNVVFGLVYDVLRSFRGVFIFAFYAMNKKTKTEFKQQLYGKNRKKTQIELSKTKSTSITEK